MFRRENFDAAVTTLGDVLGIDHWTGPADMPDIGVAVALSWDAGIEVVAPLTDEGPAAEFLAAHGEGIMGINFGVANIEDAVAWAAEHGMSPQPQTGIDGEEESEVFDDMTLRTVDRSFPNGPSRSGRCDPRSSRPPLRSVS